MNINKEFLDREYIQNKKSSRQIAREQNVSHTCISYNLKKHGIKIRKNKICKEYINYLGYNCIKKNKKTFPMSHVVWSENNNYMQVPKNCVIHHRDGNKLNNDISNLVLLPRNYHVVAHTQHKMEQKNKFLFNKEFLEKEFIKNKKTSMQIAKEHKINSKTVLRYLKKYGIKRYKHINKQLLEKEYLLRKKSSFQISKEQNVSKGMILKYLKKYKIKIRDQGKFKRKRGR